MIINNHKQKIFLTELIEFRKVKGLYHLYTHLKKDKRIRPKCSFAPEGRKVKPIFEIRY